MPFAICCCPPSQDAHNADVPKVERQHRLRAFNEEELSVDDGRIADKVYGQLQPASGPYTAVTPERTEGGVQELSDALPPSDRSSSVPTKPSWPASVSPEGDRSGKGSANRILQPKSLGEVFSNRPEIPARGSASTPEERLAAKERLKGLLTDFLKAVFSGIWVTVLNPETTASAEFVMTMDRHLFVTLRPKDMDKDGLLGFELKDGFALCKGQQIATLAPKVGHMAANITCIEQSKLGVQLFFYFQDDWENELFYSCLKVLQMSADINRKAKQGQAVDDDGLPLPAVESKGQKMPEDPALRPSTTEVTRTLV
mmetsp:Transcript_12186/g.22464  ORF Transcript_12186/g.22464 Transcript_12186/m.22464 type:complete len:313 (+) Transcript_12186:86-1024(+)